MASDTDSEDPVTSRDAARRVDEEGDRVPSEPGRVDDSAKTPARLSVARDRLTPMAIPTDDDDHALVVAARGGDTRAFALLFERHHARVHAMCRRLLADRAEVDDAVQQTFLEAWRSLPRFEGRSRFSTWITRVAIHTCLGFRRRLRRLFFAADIFSSSADRSAARGASAEPAVVDAAFSTAPPSPLEGAVHEARKRAVDDVLSTLSAKKRVVFVLAELEGMTAPEIAEIVAVPEATVRTRLFHARREFAAAALAHKGFADLFDVDDEGGAR